MAKSDAQRSKETRARMPQLRAYLKPYHWDMVERIKIHHGYETNTDVVHFLIEQEAERIKRTG